MCDSEIRGGDSARVDVVLIGGGIMSATLGALLARLQPEWSIVLLERLGDLAGESSGPWNNAGTGHSGLCELNYMPDAEDPDRAEEIARQFHLSRQLWASLVEAGELPGPASIVHPMPHMDVVFGDHDVAYLRRRFATLQRSPLFSAMQYTEDPETIRRWAPLLMDGRTDAGPIAATRYEAGTDVDFGALTRALADTMAGRGAQIRVHHEVRGLTRRADGRWTVAGRDLGSGERFSLTARFVFVGAGGYALGLLQKSGIPEIRGYAVLPVGAQFLRTDHPEVVAQHHAKVYGQAAVGAPPMSVPHLDKRVVDGRSALMFGPYATVSTRLLRHGRLVDFFRTVRPHNVAPLLAVGVQNLPLLRYLLRELLSPRRRKFAQLQRFHPAANPDHWELVRAGQRAQLITPHPRKVGVLTFGTELVTGADGTIAGLLGASPGASVAPAVMVDLLAACFPERRQVWAPLLSALMPGIDSPVDADQATVDRSLERTGRILGAM